MIVDTEYLSELRGQVTMVDGGFDPLHPGHIEYFRRAAQLGLPVLCNVSGDSWVERKHAPLLTQAERVHVIEALRDIAYVHASAGPTVDVIERARPRYYAKGNDWEGRLPPDEEAMCRDHGIDIVFLDTVLDSSTDILRRYRARAGG